MLSREDNERVTRVGRGTPMGELMRRYWIPALLGWELPEPDGPPVRVRLLGEDLVAFRDTHGRIGLLDEHCPHRRVSLFFGRNEDCGLRCVYHGWKFDVDGQCVDMMNEPESFAHKISTNSYPTAEGGGVIWAYMGPPELRPPLPHFVWTQVAPTHLMVSKVIQETNWLQGLEGGIDTSHAPILHRVLGGGSRAPAFKPSDPFVRGKAPTLELDVTEYGYRYAGLRQLHDGAIHVRAYHYILPFHQIRPGRTGPGKDYSGVAGHIWVPMDDDNTMVFNWEYSTTDPFDRRGPPRATARQRPASTSTRPRFAPAGTARTTTSSTERRRRARASRGSRASTPRIAPSRRAWGASSTGAANIWGPRTAR